MAGEATIIYGLGYTLNADKLPEGRESFDYIDFAYLPYFDRSQLVLVEPAYGARSGAFAVLAKSTVKRGDPQEWDGDYGIQNTELQITAEESAALRNFRDGAREEYPSLFEGGKALSFVLSIIADS